jgi:hypothetical protein
MSKPRFPCPCCGHFTFEEAPPGTYLICPVCYWEDDPEQFENPQSADGANLVSLEQARASYARIGAIAEEYLENVRQPSCDE